MTISSGPYQSKTYSVTPGSGAVSSTSLTSNIFYDHRGDVIAQSTPAGQWTKNVFDGADRQIESYTTDGGALSGATMNWTNANSVANDVVLSQTDTTYDADGNAILTADHERLPGDPQTGTGSTGALSDASGSTGPSGKCLLRGDVLRCRRSADRGRQRRNERQQRLCPPDNDSGFQRHNAGHRHRVRRRTACHRP